MPGVDAANCGGYHAKNTTGIGQQKKRQAKLTIALKRPESKLIDKIGRPLTVAEVEDELAVTNKKIETCKTKIEQINKKGRPKISVKDLMQALKDLDFPMTKVSSSCVCFT